MPRLLPIDERLESAAQLVVRSRIFYDIWLYFEGAETRPAIIDTMRRFNEFFRFDPHAHFVAFVVHIAALFEMSEGNINLSSLAKEMKVANMIPSQEVVEVDALFNQAKQSASKAIILRSNLFAHRSDKLSYADAFRKAAVTPNQLRDLTEIALKIANRPLLARGFKHRVFNPQPRISAEEMLKALMQKNPNRERSA